VQVVPSAKTRIKNENCDVIMQNDVIGSVENYAFPFSPNSRQTPFFKSFEQVQTCIEEI
jgi:hypothetical protein